MKAIGGTVCFFGVLAALLAGCTEIDPADGCDVSGCFTVFSEARPMSPATRVSGFEPGTGYALWVIGDDGWERPYLDTLDISSDERGEFGKTRPNSFVGTLDFYSLTFGTEAVPWENNLEYKENGVPVFSHLRNNGDGTLPDLRRAELRGCTALNTGGRVVLPFKHTLVKLGFEVVRQDVDELKGAQITDITVKDHREGRLDVSTGKYDYPGGGITSL